MFVTRPTAPRFHYSLAAVLLWRPALPAKRSAQSGDQWRPAGVTRPTNVQSNATASTNSAWQSPNGQPAATASQPGDRIKSTAPEAGKPKSAAVPPEPRTFQPPANAKRIAAAQPAVAKPTQTSTASSAANAIGGRGQGPGRAVQGATSLRSAAHRCRQIARQRLNSRRTNACPRRKRQRYGEPSDPTDNIWDTINVAFQGEPTPRSSKSVMKQDPEDLPLPSGNKPGMQDPVMRHFDGPGGFVGPYASVRRQ